MSLASLPTIVIVVILGIDLLLLLWFIFTLNNIDRSAELSAKRLKLSKMPLYH